MTTASSVKPRRYLALWLPFLPADRLHRRAEGSPKPDEAPLVFVEKVGSALHLAAADRRARTLGLAPGLTLADARARIPSLRAVEMDRAADIAFLERIGDFCDRYTPFVALDGPDGLVLDITGCAHLFDGEASLRTDLLTRLARAGIEGRASVAGTPEAAHALARFGGDAITPPGKDAEAVRPLPVRALGCEPEVVRALVRAGLQTIGDLADGSPVSLAARFGAGLVTRLSRTLGEENARITPRRPVPPCMAERHFAEPITRVEDALATLAGLAARVASSLERRGKGGRRFEAGFFRTDGKVLRLAVATARPERDSRAIVRLFRERLAALSDPLDPGFGFDLVRLSVPAMEPFTTIQADLERRASGEEEVAALTDRLTARFGRDAVLRFTAVDTHIPERAAQAVPAVSSHAGERSHHHPSSLARSLEEPDEPPTRPLHLFDPPQPIETIAEVPDGPPARFRWRRALHEVALAEGPERIAREWWRRDGDAPTRDYYRVEDTKGHRFWLFREGIYGREMSAPRWFLHGLFP